MPNTRRRKAGAGLWPSNRVKFGLPVIGGADRASTTISATGVADIIGRPTPDVLAIQEGLAFQLDDLGTVLDNYRKLGQHRSGGLEGEFSGLYVNERRVRISAGASFQ